MNKEDTHAKKNSMTERKGITPLQVVAITMLMSVIALISINSMVTYGSGKGPSEHLFENSQTISVLNQ